MKMNWFGHLVGPLLVGAVVIFGQAYLQPWVAEGVKTKESILEQRYKAYEGAVNVLQRRLASVKMKGDAVPDWYTEPSEKNPPTQLEINVAYNLLLIYGKSDTIAELFKRAAIGTDDKITPSDIPAFISAIRRDLEIDKKGLTYPKYHYIFIKPPTK